MDGSNIPQQVAIVTGASSGIGRAIALKLAFQGVTLGLIGRNDDALTTIADEVCHVSPNSKKYQVNLAQDDDLHSLLEHVKQDFGQIDILVHSAGVVFLEALETAPIEKLDWQYQINTRAPYLLTQLLLPMLRQRQGQIVFINSIASFSNKATLSQYAATKSALKAIADCLREEVCVDGMRVLSVFPGRTATPMQEVVCDAEGKQYQPEKLVQPEDVAAIVISALNLPRTAEVTDICIRPAGMRSSNFFR